MKLVSPFILSRESGCPYLSTQNERQLYVDLNQFIAGGGSYDQLINNGFRRSGNIAYVPACPNCQACESIRIDIGNYKASASDRRTLNRNKKLTGSMANTYAMPEHFKLFKRYLQTRHPESDMVTIEWEHFMQMITLSPVDSFVYQWVDMDGELIAGCLIDQTRQGLSAVYSYFNPDQPKQSLGTFIILSLIALTKQKNLPYVYLGYGVQDCSSMAYKYKFSALEGFKAGSWQKIFNT